MSTKRLSEGNRNNFRFYFSLYGEKNDKILDEKSPVLGDNFGIFFAKWGSFLSMKYISLYLQKNDNYSKE